MLYTDHNDKLVSIPTRISKYGVYTSHNILVTSIIAFNKNKLVLSFLSFVLYITSIFHWKYIRKKGLIRSLDISLATLHGLYIFYNLHWNIYMVLGLMIYISNCKLLDYGINNTKPMTYKREIVYRFNTFIHLFFLHLIHFWVIDYNLLF